MKRITTSNLSASTAITVKKKPVKRKAKKNTSDPKPVAGRRKPTPRTAPPLRPVGFRPQPLPGLTLAGLPRKRRPKRQILYIRPTKRNRRRQTTVYDAVAGRANYEGFIKKPFLNEYGEIRVRSQKARPADEVLGRRRRAPKNGWRRYEYPPEVLPVDNELAFALHTFASDYYYMIGREDENLECMDGASLIAFAVLLEEAVNSYLGETGHLALIDPDVMESDVDIN